MKKSAHKFLTGDLVRFIGDDSFYYNECCSSFNVGAIYEIIGFDAWNDPVVFDDENRLVPVEIKDLLLVHPEEGLMK